MFYSNSPSNLSLSIQNQHLMSILNENEWTRLLRLAGVLICPLNDFVEVLSVIIVMRAMKKYSLCLVGFDLRSMLCYILWNADRIQTGNCMNYFIQHFKHLKHQASGLLQILFQWRVVNLLTVC